MTSYRKDDMPSKNDSGQKDEAELSLKNSDLDHSIISTSLEEGLDSEKI